MNRAKVILDGSTEPIIIDVALILEFDGRPPAKSNDFEPHATYHVIILDEKDPSGYCYKPAKILALGGKSSLLFFVILVH